MMKRLFFGDVMPSLFLMMSLLLSSTVDSAEIETPDKALSSSTKEDWDLRMRTRKTIGMMYFTHQETFFNSDESKWQDWIPFLGLGGTLSLVTEENFYSVNLNFQKSDSGNDGIFDVYKGLNDDKILDSNINLSRRDFAISFSYGLQDRFNSNAQTIISLGYKWGQTDINGTRRDIVFSETGNTIKYRNEETQFKIEGFTGGLSFNLHRGDSSNLSIHYGFLISPNYTYNKRQITNYSELANVGISWNSTITDKWRYGLSVDYYRYQSNIFGRRTQEEITNTPDSIEETILSFEASLYYLWD